MAVSIEKGREIFDYVHGACLKMFEAVRGKDQTKDECLIFLVRALNTAAAARVLFEQGYELEATALTRSIVEGYIELSFITADKSQQAARMKLFFDHATHGRVKEAKAIAGLHGMSNTDPNLVELERRWDAVKSNYDPKRPWVWCSKFDSLWKRAQEAGRVLDQEKAKRTGAQTNEHARHFERTYELAYAEGCTAAHVSPGSFDRIPATLIGPSEPNDGTTLFWIAAMLSTLADVVGYSVDHLPESIVDRVAALLAAEEDSSA